ncbi:DUF2165 family protein [Collimonas humicola]|uniref:DUF2165 family protein n=1 Tax=Collimonas humicola TaxID=2825886 RepID=UPI001E41EE76|nr:DUF2165 domain-containing protein [Collimonas humicola]
MVMTEKVTDMMMPRLCKIVMSLCVAIFALCVTFNNIVDYDSNYQFVRHVMSMDTVFPDNRLLHRAVNIEDLWHVCYWLIIAAEGVTAILLLYGTLSLWRKRRASAPQFYRAKKWIYAGATAGFITWFFGFMVIGGEWFLMWQSADWNGQEAAFKFYLTIIGVLLFVHQPDAELPSRHCKTVSDETG